MKYFILYFMVFIGYSFVSAQEYLPLHLNYKPITKEKRVEVNDVLIVSTDKSFSSFDLFGNTIDSLPFDTMKKIRKKYRLTRVSQYAYWKDRKGNSLFIATTKIIQNRDFYKNYQQDIPFWLSIHKGRYINSSTAIGIIEKHKNKFKIWNRKRAVKRLTPIKTITEALIFLFLMENVSPYSDFYYLCEEPNYEIFTKTINPTVVKQEKDSFVINVFYNDVTDQSLYEITYQLYKNGKYRILSKKLIYTYTEDYTNGSILD